jgi:hypothetical protein
MTPPATAAAARAVARAAPGVRHSPVRHPRRISGPARGLTSRPAQAAPGIALRAIDAFEGVSSSAMLDRLIRGRIWIGLLAFALIGMVAMQLLVLELNTGIGRKLGRVATLQRQNAQLGIEDSMYSAEDRVAPLAMAAGMMLAPVGTVHFVAATPSDVSRAAAALSKPLQQPVSSSTGSEVAAQESSTTTSEQATGPSSTTSSTASTAEASGATTPGSASTSEASGATTSSGTASTGEASSASTPSSAAVGEASGSTENSPPATGG